MAARNESGHSERECAACRNILLRCEVKGYPARYSLPLWRR